MGSMGKAVGKMDVTSRRFAIELWNSNVLLHGTWFPIRRIGEDIQLAKLRRCAAYCKRSVTLMRFLLARCQMVV